VDFGRGCTKWIAWSESKITGPSMHCIGRMNRGVVFGVSIALSWALILLFKPQLEQSDLAAGSHAVAIVIPFLMTSAYLFFLILFRKLTGSRLALEVTLLYVIGSIGLTDMFFEPIWHYYFNDPGRYSNYAHLMISEGTFWGGDALGGFGANVPYFVDQPGYRYFLGLMMLICGGENRLLQITNLGLYLISLTLFLQIYKKHDDRLDTRLVLLFLFLCLPYAANNILEGLSEWCAIMVFFLAFGALYKRYWIVAAILLGLVPILRQNLILVSIFIAVAYLRPVKWQISIVASLLFASVVALPLAHNIIYADEFRLFSVNIGNRIQWGGSFSEIILQASNLVARKIPHYLGYSPYTSPLRTVVTMAFVPMGSLLILWFLYSVSGRQKLTLLIAASVTIGPTLIFGWGYFPRFVFVNQTIVLLVVLMGFRLHDCRWQKQSIKKRGGSSLKGPT
jgi:hypothetical protein